MNVILKEKRCRNHKRIRNKARFMVEWNEKKDWFTLSSSVCCSVVLLVNSSSWSEKCDGLHEIQTVFIVYSFALFQVFTPEGWCFNILYCLFFTDFGQIFWPISCHTFLYIKGKNQAEIELWFLLFKHANIFLDDRIFRRTCASGTHRARISTFHRFHLAETHHTWMRRTRYITY